jgi:dolichyl-phosphate-mannose-protein mannosyltransferase
MRELMSRTGATPAGAPDRFRIRSCPGLLNKSSFSDWLLFGIMAAAIGLVLLTFRDYGVTWDEDVHNWYGNFVLDYYLSFFDNKTALHWRDLYNYGAIFDTAAAVLNRISLIGVYETRHLLNGLVGILGLIGCWKLAREVGGARAGLLATLFLMLTPNYYGQMFNNPKDIPFAVGVVWASYYMVRILPTLPHPSFQLTAKLGVAIGMTMGVRIGGLLLLCYLGLFLALDAAWRAFAAQRIAVLLSTAWTSGWRVFVPALLVAYPVMLLFWPWAQTDPIENPFRAFVFFSHQSFPFGRDELFEGRVIPTSDLPWTYLPIHIILTLPELVLVLILYAPVAVSIALWRGNFDLCCEQVLARFVIGFGVVFPVAYAIATRPPLFDGMRHFIFVLPLIAVGAALTADRALVTLANCPYRRAIFAVLALYGIGHVTTLVMLHPDQYVYYNAFVGGVEGAQHKFKLDYWANSYAEAVQGLEDYLRTTYGADFEEREFTVAVCGPANSARYYFPPNFRLTRKLSEAEFFISYTKDNCDKSVLGLAVYRVERIGALLSTVLDHREFTDRAIAKTRALPAPRAAAAQGLP